MLSTEKKFTKFMQIVFNLHLEISNSKRACSLTFTLQFSYPSHVEDADGCKTHSLLKMTQNININIITLVYKVNKKYLILLSFFVHLFCKYLSRFSTFNLKYLFCFTEVNEINLKLILHFNSHIHLMQIIQMNAKHTHSSK